MNLVYQKKILSVISLTIFNTLAVRGVGEAGNCPSDAIAKEGGFKNSVKQIAFRGGTSIARKVHFLPKTSFPV